MGESQPASRVPGTAWGKATEPKPALEQTTSSGDKKREAPRESGWSDEDEEPVELSTGAEATASVEEAEEKSQSETTTALAEQGEDNATEEIEELDEKEEKDWIAGKEPVSAEEDLKDAQVDETRNTVMEERAHEDQSNENG